MTAELKVLRGERIDAAKPAVTDLWAVERRLPSLTMSDLVAALGIARPVPWDELEFRCPSTLGAAESHSASINSPAPAECTYWCPTCRRTGTRWELERLVREDFEALRRIQGWLQEAAL